MTKQMIHEMKLYPVSFLILICLSACVEVNLRDLPFCSPESYTTGSVFQNDSLLIQIAHSDSTAEILVDICDPPEQGIIVFHTSSRLSYVPTIAAGVDEFVLRRVIMSAPDTHIQEQHHAIQIFEDSAAQCVDRLLQANPSSKRLLQATTLGHGKVYFVPGKRFCRGFVHSFRITKKPEYGVAEIIADETFDSLLLYTRVEVPPIGFIDSVQSEYCVNREGEIICKDFIHLVEYVE